MSDKIECPHCNRRFADKNSVYSHCKAKHPNKERKQFAPVRDDEEESFADRAVQAEIDRACGIPNDDDWLLP